MSDFRTWWNLDTELCKFLANNLNNLATGGNSYPESYETVENWRGTLIHHAKVFQDYVNMRDSLFTPEDSKESVENAKASLYWVAENLKHLWD